VHHSIRLAPCLTLQVDGDSDSSAASRTASSLRTHHQKRKTVSVAPSVCIVQSSPPVIWMITFETHLSWKSSSAVVAVHLPLLSLEFQFPRDDLDRNPSDISELASVIISICADFKSLAVRPTLLWRIAGVPEALNESEQLSTAISPEPPSALHRHTPGSRSKRLVLTMSSLIELQAWVHVAFLTLQRGLYSDKMLWFKNALLRLAQEATVKPL